MADVFGWEKTRRANTEHCPASQPGTGVTRTAVRSRHGRILLLKTPARVACQTLRQKLQNVNLADALPKRLVAKRSVTGLFCYSEDDANTKKRTVGADRFRVEWETLTGGELLDRCTRTSSDYYYYTTTYDNDGADWWRGAIGGDVVDALPRKTSLWVGGNGSTTQAHYDVADNILGQCIGTKRIRCWAPSSHWAMTPFPDAHPLARKAQIDIHEMPDRTRRDSSSRATRWRSRPSGSTTARSASSASMASSRRRADDLNVTWSRRWRLHETTSVDGDETSTGLAREPRQYANAVNP